jgi:hypothetical protein
MTILASWRQTTEKGGAIMKHGALGTCLFSGWLLAATPVLGDGGYFHYFHEEGQAANLAQTRQEVLLAFYDSASNGLPHTTYVLRTQYSGDPSDFGWVIPIPATPTDVVALEDSDLFTGLDTRTKPRFNISGAIGGGGGCIGCSAGGGGAGGLEAGQVEVEARGQAGIFDWVALTSTGSDALLDWLHQNDFVVSTAAGDVLDYYIQAERHFLAVRVSEPEQLNTSATGDIEIPPIQFTCQTSERFYPMAISQVSAADETEVLVYIVADHRAEAVNAWNVLIDPDRVEYDPSSPSRTNYEDLFTQTITDHGGLALVTEYVQPTSSMPWTQAPLEVAGLGFLTRMRTVIAREDMTLDYSFRDAATDQTVSPTFSVDISGEASAAAVTGPPLAVLLAFGALRVARGRRARSRRRH